MKSSLSNSRSSIRYSLALAVVLLCAFAAAPLLSRSQAQANTINVVNNSSREMRHVYLSPADSDDWGPDQLNDSAVISPGGSFTISNVSCSGANIKVVAEDADGCFVSKVVACAANASWTITNDDTPNCGN
ncbi:MAG: hypothetical protein QOJ02_1052 [Acidobacteriota bacterium]|nr:hypothetical protein [Acidobacteriota bacterium]